jgi:hypothetical protein
MVSALILPRDESSAGPLVRLSARSESRHRHHPGKRLSSTRVIDSACGRVAWRERPRVSPVEGANHAISGVARASAVFDHGAKEAL